MQQQCIFYVCHTVSVVNVKNCIHTKVFVLRAQLLDLIDGMACYSCSKLSLVRTCLCQEAVMLTTINSVCKWLTRQRMFLQLVVITSADLGDVFANVCLFVRSM